MTKSSYRNMEKNRGISSILRIECDSNTRDQLLKSHESYYGEINNKGERHGYGYYDGIGYTYDGQWKNDKFHGKGILKEYELYCNTFNCTWKDNHIRGIGEITYEGERTFGYLIEDPKSLKIWRMRRSRRLANFPVENTGIPPLHLPNKPKKAIKKYYQTYDSSEDIKHSNMELQFYYAFFTFIAYVMFIAFYYWLTSIN